MTTIGQIPPSKQRQKQNHAMPRIPPFPDFMLQAHPQRWTVYEGKLIPRLGKLPIQVGVGRVSADGDPNDAIANRTKRGWTVIATDIDGAGTSYVRAYRVVPQGKDDPDYVPTQFAHVGRWSKVHAGSDHIGEGGSEYAEWCESLVTREIVAPILAYVVERMIDEKTRQIEQYTPKAEKRPMYRRICEQLEGELAILRTELEAAKLREADQPSGEAIAVPIVADPAPAVGVKPPTKRRRKKAEDSP